MGFGQPSWVYGLDGCVFQKRCPGSFRKVEGLCRHRQDGHGGVAPYLIFRTGAHCGARAKFQQIQYEMLESGVFFRITRVWFQTCFIFTPTYWRKWNPIGWLLRIFFRKGWSWNHQVLVRVPPPEMRPCWGFINQDSPLTIPFSNHFKGPWSQLVTTTLPMAI